MEQSERMKIAIISVGDPFLKDDGIANEAISDLVKGENLLVIRAENKLEDFIIKIKEFSPDTLFIVDASPFGGEPGDVKVFNHEDIFDVFSSTHHPPIKILKTALPKTKIKVIGIQPKLVDYGDQLSSELKKKLPEIKEEIAKLVKHSS